MAFTLIVVVVVEKSQLSVMLPFTFLLDFRCVIQDWNFIQLYILSTIYILIYHQVFSMIGYLGFKFIYLHIFDKKNIEIFSL